MNRSDLERLSKEELIDLVLQLQRPGKTSRTSSKPPSTDQKERRENAKPGGAKPGHEGHSRKLCENPDAFEDHAPTHCEHCGLAFGADAERELTGEYDEIELPPVRPFVRRHRRLSIRCSCCNADTKAKLPTAAVGTPFCPNIHALAIYLKETQLFSYERLRRFFADVCGLAVSEGALMNMFRRSAVAFAGRREGALATLRKARFVASDETGVRIEGVNAYHWVFHCAQAVVHGAAFTRGAVVVHETMAGHRPEVWTSDRYSAQQGHAARQQTCLAHLKRKARFADENGEGLVAWRIRTWLDRAFALAKNIGELAPSTIKSRRRKLERDLNAILVEPTTCSLAAELQGQFARAKDQLLTFCDYPSMVEPTNNACERDLRPAVIQRKVTNGHRAKWGADHSAAVQTTLDTARLAGARPFQTILTTIAV